MLLQVYATLNEFYLLERDGGSVSEQSMIRYFQCVTDLETGQARTAIECPEYRGRSEHDDQHLVLYYLVEI